MTLLGHIGPRHPLCPECRYDLVATIEARGRRCPECGHAFELGELVNETRDGDWTAARGLRRAGLVLLIKSVICVCAWATMLWLNGLLPAWSATWPRPAALTLTIGAGLTVIAAGGACGWVLARRFDEHLGFTNIPVAAFVVVLAWTVLVVAALIAIGLLGMRSVEAGRAIPVAGLIATAFIVKKLVLDEQ